MANSFTHKIAGIFLLILLASAQGFAAVGSLTVDVPKTAYIQWLPTAATAMTSVDGDNTAAFANYVGGAVTQLTQPANKDVFLGVMCNSLAGYDLTLTANNSGSTTTTGEMTITGGTNLTYTATLAKEASSFSSGTTASTSLDLTGATVSGTTVHTAEADLPMTAASPNVWKVTLALPTISSVSDGLIMSGTYSGGITATVALK